MNNDMNKDIKEYTTPSGQIRYKFLLYVGVDDTNGRSVQIKKQGFKTLTEAQESYLKFQLMVIKGEYVPSSKKRLRFRDLYKMWFKQYKKRGIKESTYSTTERYFKDHILPKLGDEYLDKLTVIKCQNAVDSWFEKAPRTFKRFIRYTDNVLNYGIKLEILSKNPMSKTFRPRVKDKQEKYTDFYSKDELNHFLECAEKYNYRAFMFFRLLAYSGMRKGECLALKWSDIDFKNNLIQVNKTETQGENNRLYVEDTPKTTKSIRTLDMDRETMNYLSKWRTKQQELMLKLGFNFLSDDNLIFPTINNGLLSPSKPDQWNRAICKKYNLRRIKIHGFRHTHASLLFQTEGVQMEDVKERLGHKDIKTTMNVYTHVSPERKKDTAKQFEQFMNAK